MVMKYAIFRKNVVRDWEVQFSISAGNVCFTFLSSGLEDMHRRTKRQRTFFAFFGQTGSQAIPMPGFSYGDDFLPNCYQFCSTMCTIHLNVLYNPVKPDQNPDLTLGASIHFVPPFPFVSKGNATQGNYFGGRFSIFEAFSCSSHALGHISAKWKEIDT
jgi:hypothetical protein